MRYIGIDPGFGRCGFGVIEGAGFIWKCLTHGVITTRSDTMFPDRLLEIATDFERVLNEFLPDTLVIEELFFSKSTTTALKVAEVRGMIMFLAARRAMSVLEVKPNEVKMAVTGYGKAEKKQMQEMIKTIFGFSSLPQSDDSADALAIAWTGAGKTTFKVGDN